MELIMELVLLALMGWCAGAVAWVLIGGAHHRRRWTRTRR